MRCPATILLAFDLLQPDLSNIFFTLRLYLRAATNYVGVLFLLINVNVLFSMKYDYEEITTIVLPLITYDYC